MPAKDSSRCRDCGAVLTEVDPYAPCPACGTSVVIPSVSLGGILQSDTLSEGDALRSSSSVLPTSLGPRASLTDAGLKGSVTLERSPADRDQGTITELLAAEPSDHRYVVAGEVGRGGMGVVLRAIDRDLRRDVALKLLQQGQQPFARDRFVEEAQIAGQLEHPNIVPVHDLGVAADGQMFFTMKLVKGRSLGQVLESLQEPEPPEDAPSLRRLLRLFLAVLDAMAFAHDRGVIHRDLKPANIMLGDFGEVLVMDWGLARVIRGEQGTRRFKPKVQSQASGRAADARLATIVHGFQTYVEGPIEGTPAYMPPEQARGNLAAIDERSDIYSLGAILYEILCLSPPVRGNNLKAVLEDVIAHRILPPEERSPERNIPPELSAIALKALAADSSERYQTVLELRRDIELFLEGRQVSAKEDTPWEAVVKLVRRNHEVSIAIAVSVVVVIVLTIVLFTAIVKERHRFQTAAAEAQRRLTDLKREQEHRALDQRRAAPALVARARRSIDRKEFEEARKDAELALQYDPALRDAQLLNAHLAIHDRRWPDAIAALEDYRRLAPDDTGATELSRLCATVMNDTATTPNAATLTHLGDLLVDEGAFTIAEGLYQDGRSLVSAYRVRLERAWPGCTRQGFTADAEGRLTIEGLAQRSDVADLTPLAGLPIVRLSLAGTRVLDLMPLKGMPLRFLDVSDTLLRSLDALVDLPLTDLRLARTRIDDLSGLKNLPLTYLDLTATPVMDLAALTDLPLTTLILDHTPVEDLRPLHTLPLTELRLSGTRVSDIRPIADRAGPGMTLERLILPRGTPIGLEDLKKLPSLTKIGSTWQGSWLKALDAKDFWDRPQVQSPKP